MPKGYPRTRFDIVDNTHIQEISNNVVPDPTALLMIAHTSDKGPEDWMVHTDLTDFTDVMGGFSFPKHGAPQLLIGEVLRAGGNVLSKRLVAEDATLANTTVRVRVVTDETNAYLYPYTRSAVGAKTFKEACDIGYNDFDLEDPLYKIPEVIQPTTPVEPEEVKGIYAAPVTAGAFEAGSYSIECATKNEDGSYNVVVNISKLKKHQNAEHQDGYWCGIFIEAPAELSTGDTVKLGRRAALTAEKVETAEFRTDENYKLDKIKVEEAEKKGYAVYFDAINWPTAVLDVKWGDNEAIRYNISFSNVEFEYDEEDDPANKPPAPVFYDIPLFTIAPKGRGASNMTFRIVPEYYASKSSQYTRYSFEVYEGANMIESISFTMNSEIIVDNTSQSLQYKVGMGSRQVNAKFYEDGLLALLGVLVNYATLDGEPVASGDLVNLDFINGMNRRGTEALGGIITRINSDDGEELWTASKPEDIEVVYDLNDPVGLPLANGSFGSISMRPIEDKEAYTEMLLGAFGADVESPLFDPVIYDVDAYKIEAVVDFGYDMPVKKAIANMCDFRGDCVFLADLGYDVHNLADALDKAVEMPTTRNIAMYCNSYNILNPYTKKEITVTTPFSLAIKLVNHYNYGVGRPFAGIANDMYFPEIIPGTMNFIPVNIPGLDQKQMLADSCINYISYYDGVPVMETMYTNQPDYTEFSYLHNIMAVQEIVKVVRARCPRSRYTFLDGSDLEHYIEDVEAVIRQYSTYFKSISVQYMADELYEQNNIFYAVIKVSFRNFVQEEYFKIIAID